MADRKRIVMWGASDQARVNEPIIRDSGAEIAALVDDTEGLKSFVPQVPILLGRAALEPWLKDRDARDFHFVVAIANPFGHIRVRLHKYLMSLGMTPFTVRDRTSYVSESARLGLGNQLMPLSVVHTAAVVHDQCIINTGAIVEHDCVLHDGAALAPGATLCGRVTVGEFAWVCAGATVLPRLRIGKGAIVGAGAVVREDVADFTEVAGVPATFIRRTDIDD